MAIRTFPYSRVDAERLLKRLHEKNGDDSFIPCVFLSSGKSNDLTRKMEKTKYYVNPDLTFASFSARIKCQKTYANTTLLIFVRDRYSVIQAIPSPIETLAEIHQKHNIDGMLYFCAFEESVFG